jgi:hypothetical protein
MANSTKSKGRQKFEAIQPPSRIETHPPEERVRIIQEIFAGFVAPSAANKRYYKVIIECLWPPGHGIPGPHITQNEIRQAVDNFRQASWPKDKPYKPYIDVFRRARELQGEEGLTGVAISGKTYQLISLELSQKRVPRTKLSDADWGVIKDRHNNVCAACRKAEPEVRFQQDHKIPRTRNGEDGLDNWQPLCDECNNFKSVSCRGCELDCNFCCWAFPEKYRPLRLPQNLLSKINAYCRDHSVDINEFACEVLTKSIGEN